MQQTVITSDVVQAIRAERAWWDDLVASTTPAQMETVKVTEDWTIRDLAAHLLSWWSWRLTRLQAEAGRQPKPEPAYPTDLASIDEQNAWFDRHNVDLPAKEITDSFAQTFTLLEEIVTRLPEDELDDPTRISFLGGRSLGREIAEGRFFEHFHGQHASEIAAWERAVGK
jgi:hypothetical protein